MQAWRTRLLNELLSANDKATKEKEALWKRMVMMSPQAHCAHCQQKCFSADGLVLKCTHFHCFDCLSDMLERQKGYFERQKNTKLLETYSVLLSIVVCTDCHIPCCVVPRNTYLDRFGQKERGLRGTFVIDGATSDTLASTSNHRIYEYYENQWRSLLGKFKPTKNFLRPPHSDKHGKPLTQSVEDINGYDGTETDGVIETFLEDWCCDVRRGDPQGWHYCTYWPKTEKEWVYAPSAGTFVRQRLKRRTSIKLAASRCSVQSLMSDSTTREKQEELVTSSTALLGSNAL